MVPEKKLPDPALFSVQQVHKYFPLAMTERALFRLIHKERRILWLHSGSVAEPEIKLRFLYNSSSRQWAENTFQTDLQHSGPSVSFLCEVFLFAASNDLKQILGDLLLTKECEKFAGRQNHIWHLGLLWSLGVALNTLCSVASLNPDLGF